MSIAAKYTLLLNCSHFCCSPSPTIFPLANLCWSSWIFRCHCWCGVAIAMQSPSLKSSIHSSAIMRNWECFQLSMYTQSPLLLSAWCAASACQLSKLARTGDRWHEEMKALSPCLLPRSINHHSLTSSNVDPYYSINRQPTWSTVSTTQKQL